MNIALNNMYSEFKMAAPMEADVRQCKYYVKRKGRFCKLIPGVGKQFCGEHVLFSPDEDEAGERKRIPCPVDHKHTIFEDQLKKHLKKCNAKLKQNYEYYKKNINAGSDDDDTDEQPKISLQSMDLDRLKSIISKVKKCYNDNKIALRDEVLDHEVFREELENAMNGASARKHLVQQASLLGHLRKKGLLKNKTCFIEFGAGRGQLSHWLQKALPDSTDVKVILVDRGHNRRKLDCYHRNKGPKFERLNLDISDLELASVPGIKDNNYPLVGISKHLCGAATDLALRCLMNFYADSSISGIATQVKGDCGNPAVDQPQVKPGDVGNRAVNDSQMEGDGGDQTVNEPHQAKHLCVASDQPSKKLISGIVFALCCHHRCNWKNYVGKRFFKDSDFTPEEFTIMTHLTSWAVCGTKNKPESSDDAVNKDESYDKAISNEHSVAEEPASSDFQSQKPQQEVDLSRSDVLSAEERAEIGRQCKRLIDVGRVKYMEDHGFNVDMVHYVQRDISLENLVFIATPKNDTFTSEQS